MKKREQMRMSNQKAREFLFAEGYDWLWFKTHADSRRKKNRDYYYMANGDIIGCMDPYNLFDAMGFDGEGILWFIQIKTGNWPDKNQIDAFLINKHGVNIMAINVKPPKTKGKTYQIKTRVYSN